MIIIKSLLYYRFLMFTLTVGNILKCPGVIIVEEAPSEYYYDMCKISSLLVSLFGFVSIR